MQSIQRSIRREEGRQNGHGSATPPSSEAPLGRVVSRVVLVWLGVRIRIRICVRVLVAPQKRRHRSGAQMRMR